MFGFPYVKCDLCGRVVDEWTLYSKENIILCFECDEKRVQEKEGCEKQNDD